MPDSAKIHLDAIADFIKFTDIQSVTVLAIIVYSQLAISHYCNHGLLEEKAGVEIGK